MMKAAGKGPLVLLLTCAFIMTGSGVAEARGKNPVVTGAHALVLPSVGDEGLAAPSAIRADRASDTSLKVRWSKVSGAKSYKVYQLVKGKWKVAKTTSSLSWVDKKLPKQKVQQYRVAACKGVKGKGACGPLSMKVSAITHSKKSKKVNAGRVVLSQIPPDLGLLDEWAFVVKLGPAVKGKALVSQNIVVVSSSPSVVSVERVSSYTDVHHAFLAVKGFGSAKITVTAHNGVSASFWVRVRDLSQPIDYKPSGLSRPNAAIVTLVKAHGPKLSALVRYALTLPSVTGEFAARLGEDGEVEVMEGTMKHAPAYIQSYVRDILRTGSVYPTEMSVTQQHVSVDMRVADVGVWSLTYSTYIGMVYYGEAPKTHWEMGFGYRGPTDGW